MVILNWMINYIYLPPITVDSSSNEFYGGNQYFCKVFQFSEGARLNVWRVLFTIIRWGFNSRIGQCVVSLSKTHHFTLLCDHFAIWRVEYRAPAQVISIWWRARTHVQYKDLITKSKLSVPVSQQEIAELSSVVYINRVHNRSIITINLSVDILFLSDKGLRYINLFKLQKAFFF